MHRDDVVAMLNTFAAEFEAFAAGEDDDKSLQAVARAYRRAAELVQGIDLKARRRRRRVARAATAPATRRRGRPRRAAGQSQTA